MAQRGMGKMNPISTHPWQAHTRQVLTMRQARGILLGIFGFLAFLYLFKSYPSPDSRYDDLSYGNYTVDGEGGSRVAKMTMLYGKPNPLYERAVRSHKLHNKMHGYPMHVLRHEISGGYWNKPAYVLSLIIAELAKPPGQRTEWLMWVDADLVLVNPAISLEIFLPPWDFENIHFIGNKDQNGLNTGTFFIHVHEWSVRMLTKAMGYPMFKPDVDLGVSMDQEAMKMIFREKEFAVSVLYQPRVWFNTYEFHHGYEGKKGHLLVHFPGLEDDRWKHMNDWLAITEANPHSWEVRLEDTSYPADINKYYEALREARKVLAFADKKAETGEGIDKEAVYQSSNALRDTLLRTPDSTDQVKENTQELKELVAYST